MPDGPWRGLISHTRSPCSVSQTTPTPAPPPGWIWPSVLTAASVLPHLSALLFLPVVSAQVWDISLIMSSRLWDWLRSFNLLPNPEEVSPDLIKQAIIHMSYIILWKKADQGWRISGDPCKWEDPGWRCGHNALSLTLRLLLTAWTRDMAEIWFPFISDKINVNVDFCNSEKMCKICWLYFNITDFYNCRFTSDDDNN